MRAELTAGAFRSSGHSLKPSHDLIGEITRDRAMLWRRSSGFHDESVDGRGTRVDQRD